MPWLRDERGVSSIEFAILAPIVFILLLGTLEMAFDMIVGTSVQLAAQAASRAGLTTTAPAGGISRTTQAQNIVMSYLGGWTKIGGTLTVTETSYSAYNYVGSSNNASGEGGLGSIAMYSITLTMKNFTGIPTLAGLKTMTYQCNYLVQNEK